jgi:hypothetical protein
MFVLKFEIRPKHLMTKQQRMEISQALYVLRNLSWFQLPILDLHLNLKSHGYIGFVGSLKYGVQCYCRSSP